MLLRSKNGELGSRARGAEARKKAMERQLAQKVKLLEAKVEDKLNVKKGEDMSLEEKIKQSLIAKDHVY